MSERDDELDLLAAEYVLGLAEGTALRRAHGLLVRDADFARRVDDWSRKLMPVLDAVPPMRPPSELWQRIEAARRRRAEDAFLEEKRPPARPKPRAGFWRWYALGATALAAALAAFIVLGPLTSRMAPVPAEQRFVAVLNEGAASPSWLVTVDLAERSLTIRPLADVQVAGRDLELWLVAGAGARPRSLGLLDPQGSRALTLGAALAAGFEKGGALAVSLEPEGGSPTGLPTGPVLYQGSILPVAGED